MAVSRKVDELGRITIPKVIRQSLNLIAGTKLNIREENGEIVLEKDSESCTICGLSENLIEFNGVKVCDKCINEIKKQS